MSLIINIVLLQFTLLTIFSLIFTFVYKQLDNPKGEYLKELENEKKVLQDLYKFKYKEKQLKDEIELLNKKLTRLEYNEKVNKKEFNDDYWLRFYKAYINE